MTAQNAPVVVGVDGSSANTAAQQYAVREARRLGAPLEVVHVVPDRVSASPWWPLAADLPDEPGVRIVRDVEEDVERSDPDVDVVGWVHRGPRVARLAECADRAVELVVGRDDRPLVERLLLGDTATGVAARASVPVVQVPAGWSDADSGGVVLVGAKSPDDADPVLEDAFALAEARGAELVVIHAWRMPGGYDVVVDATGAVEQWRREATAQLEQALTGWRQRHPDVKVEVRVVRGQPGPALIDAADAADVVVIGRRRRGVPPSTHLGTTARAVLRAAPCPVRVVPPAAT